MTKTIWEGFQNVTPIIIFTDARKAKAAFVQIAG
jgi:hypothetical protein